jgi:hypothetical protein
MAGKITEMTSGTPVESDWMEFTDDPSGTPLTRRCTIADLLSAGDAYGAIYRDVTTGPSSNTITTSYAKIVDFDTDGLSLNTTPSHANDQITVNVTGVYEVSFGISHSGSNGAIYTVAVHVNSAEQVGIVTKRTIGTGTDIGSSARTGILSLTAGDVVDLRVKAASGTPDFDVESMGLFVHRIG